LLFPKFRCFFIISFRRFFYLLSTSKKIKWKKKEWKKLWEELHRIGHATQNWEKEIERNIFVVSIVRSFVRSFLILILTFWKGQQKNWCFLVLHRMTIFLTMNIFSENYDAFTEMGRFNEMFFNWRLKLNNKQFKSLSNTANLLASLNYEFKVHNYVHH
jgi:hypothetical protein